jgi:hypothetical protein
MPFEEFSVLPTLQAINNHTCTLYPNSTMIADNGWKCYQMSNASWVASAKEVLYYTDSEILKIEVAGGVLVLAFLVITYALYKWYMQRYYRWQRNERIREKMASKTVTDDDLRELEMPLPGINKGLMLLVGLLVIVAGLVVWLMP